MIDHNEQLKQCCILVALPTSETEFRLGFDGEHFADFCHSYSRMDRDEAWAKHYSKIAHAFRDLVEFANSLGAQVRTCATLSDLHDAAKHYGLLILFAHQKGAGIGPNDIEDSVAVMADISAASATIANKIDTLALQKGSSLRDALNNAIYSGLFLQLLTQNEYDLIESTPSIRATISRDLLDEITSSDFRPGNKAEFFDGLHSLGEVVAAIDGGAVETFDLAMCESETVAVLKDLSSISQPTMLSRPGLTDPIPEIVGTRSALRLVSEQGYDYSTARGIVATQMKSMWRKPDDLAKHTR